MKVKYVGACSVRLGNESLRGLRRDGIHFLIETHQFGRCGIGKICYPLNSERFQPGRPRRQELPNMILGTEIRRMSKQR